MSDQGKITIVTQKDLAIVVESICNNIDAGNAVVTALNTSAKTINGILSKNEMSNTIGGLEKFQKNVVKYNSIVETIIKTLISPMEGVKDFSEFLGRYKEQDENGNEIPNGKIKYTAVEAAQQIPALISTAFKAMEEASSSKLAGNATRNIRKNMKNINKMFELIVSGMIGGFAEMSKKYDLNELLNILVKEPDKTMTSVKNNITGEGSDLKDLTTTDTTKVVGRIGILDGIIQTFSIFDLMSKLNPPNFIVLKIRLKRSLGQLRFAISELFKFSKKNTNLLKEVNTFTAELTKDNGISAFFREIKTALFGQVVAIFSKTSVKTLKKSISRIPEVSGIFDAIVTNIIQNKNAVLISSKTTETYARALKANMEKIGEIVKSISSIILNLIAINTFSSFIKKGFISLGAVFNKAGQSFKVILDSFNKYDLLKTVETVNDDTINLTEDVKTFAVNTDSLFKEILKINTDTTDIDDGIDSIENITNSIKTIVERIYNTDIQNIDNDGISKLAELIVPLNEAISKINIIYDNIKDISNKYTDGYDSIKLLNNILESINTTITYIYVINNDINKLIESNNISETLLNVNTILLEMDTVISMILLISNKLLKSKNKFNSNIETLRLLTESLRVIVLAFNNLSNESKNIKLNGINDLKAVITLLKDISKLVIRLGALGIGVKISSILINILLNSLTNIVDNIIKLSKKMSDKDVAANNIINKLDDMAQILNKVRTISINAILLGVMAIPVLLCIPLIAILLLELIAIARMLQLTGKILSKITTNVVPNFSVFGISMLIILGVLIVVGTALILLSAIKEQILGGFMAALAVIGVTMVLALALAGIAYLMPYLLPTISITFAGIALVAGTVIVLLGICSVLIQLSKIKFDKKLGEELSQKIEDIFIVIGKITENVIKYSLKVKDLRKSKRAIKQINKTVYTITEIADKLNSLQKIVLNTAAINNNVNAIFNTISELENKIINFNNISENSPTNNENVISAINNARKHKKVFKKSTKTFKRAEKLLIEVNDMAEQLEFLSKFNITSEVVSNITSNIQNIFSTISDIEQIIIKGNTPDGTTSKLNISTEEIKELRKNKRREKRALRKQTKAVTKTSALITSLGDILDVLDSLSEDNKFKLDETKKTAITTNVENIMDLVNNIINTVISKGSDNIKNRDINSFDKISNIILTVADTFDKMAGADQNALNKNISTYSGFIDKINTVDITKLETSANMFAQMAKFSNSIQGDFKQLAETLNEHLMPVLEELKEIMGVIPEKLDTGFQNTSASIAATTVAPTTETVTAQVNRENPTMTKKEVDTIVQQRMKDYSKTEATGVTAKLDQLIDLLKGYSGENVMVKTI